MNSFLKTTACIVALSMLLSGCGVMFGGSKFGASIIAKNHPDASIYVNGNKIGEGTAIGKFPRNRNLTVELRQDGCAPQSKTYPKAFRGGNFFLSVLTWGVVGLIVDFSTGACFKPDHKVDPEIQRMSTKAFIFSVDYKGCPTTASGQPAPVE